MIAHFYVVSYEEDGAGDGYGRFVTRSFDRARRHARTTADTTLDGIRHEQARFGDAPTIRRTDVVGLGLLHVDEVFVSGSATDVALRCATLLVDGSSDDGRGSVRYGRKWGWDNRRWALAPRKEDSR